MDPDHPTLRDFDVVEATTDGARMHRVCALRVREDVVHGVIVHEVGPDDHCTICNEPLGGDT